VTKPPYELWKGRPTNVKHLKVFGSKCYIKRDDDNLGKFDSRYDEGIFLGYSSQRKSYRCFNLRLDKIVESENVRVDDENPGRIKMQTNDQPTITSCSEEEKR
jgi:hypothetical protein